MKEIWVLLIKTSLPKACYSDADLKLTFFAYESFDKARDALRAKLKEFAFSRNEMFDGKGGLKEFYKYLSDGFDEEDEEDEDSEVLNKKRLSAILSALTSMFSGENTVLPLEDGKYTDWMIAVDVSDGAIRFYGDDDGPDNGYIPKLATNMFSMDAEQDYYLYIDDMLGQECASSELYIDLKKTTLE